MANRRFQAHRLSLLRLPLFPVELLFPSNLSQGLLVVVHLTTSQGERIQYCQSSTENNYWWYWYLHKWPQHVWTWFDKKYSTSLSKSCTSQLTGSHKAASWAIRAVTSRRNWGQWQQSATKTDQTWPFLNLSLLFYTIFTSLHGTPWCSDVSLQQQQMQSEPSCTKGKALEAACRLGSFVGICSLGDLEKRAQIGQESVHVHTIYYILYTMYYVLCTIYYILYTIYCIRGSVKL